jgi:hypothetical protein
MNILLSMTVMFLLYLPTIIFISYYLLSPITRYLFWNKIKSYYDHNYNIYIFIIIMIAIFVIWAFVGIMLFMQSSVLQISQLYNINSEYEFCQYAIMLSFIIIGYLFYKYGQISNENIKLKEIKIIGNVINEDNRPIIDLNFELFIFVNNYGVMEYYPECRFSSNDLSKYEQCRPKIALTEISLVNGMFTILFWDKNVHYVSFSILAHGYKTYTKKINIDITRYNHVGCITMVKDPKEETNNIISRENNDTTPKKARKIIKENNGYIGFIIRIVLGTLLWLLPLLYLYAKLSGDFEID